MFDLYNTLESYNIIDNDYAYEGIIDKVKNVGSTIWGFVKKMWKGMKAKLAWLVKKMIRSVIGKDTKKKSKDDDVIEVDAKPVNNKSEDSNEYENTVNNAKSNINARHLDVKLLEKFFNLSMKLSSIHSIINRYRIMLNRQSLHDAKIFRDLGVDVDDIKVDENDNDDEENKLRISETKSFIEELQETLNKIPKESRIHLKEFIKTNESVTKAFVTDCNKTIKEIDEILKEVDKLVKTSTNITEKTKNIIITNTKEISQIVAAYYKCMSDAYFLH